MSDGLMDRTALEAQVSLTPRGEPVAPVTNVFLAKYAIAYCGLFVALLTPVAMTLAIRIGALDATGKGASLGSILGLGALFALIANPLFGQISDRTQSPLGRRKPWIVAGVIIGSLAQVAIAYVSSLVVIGIAWCVAQTAYNAALAALVAVVPDQVPEQQRGKISALMGMSIYIALLIGSAVLTFVGTVGVGMFIIPAVIGLFTTLLFAVGLTDVRKSKAAAQTENRPLLAELAGMFWVNPVKFPDFGWAWASRFLVFLGMSVLMTYQVYYLTDVLGFAADAISRIMFLSTLITAGCVLVSSLVAGWLSDRFQRRKIFVFIAATVYAFGILLIVFSTGLFGFLFGVSVSSLGFGVYLAVDQALVVDVLPNRETDAGKNMGVLNIANAVPQSIAPAIAPIFLAMGSATGQNYALLYAIAALCAFLGALAIAPVRGVR
ncbi:MFS transporter [Rhizobium rhizogenes]|uniref:MFS transporter n=1 Tax=Rhizobium rhizogenes TaxID=359 RepID=UPI00157265A7|nr:MFS transporter [Rhizobium rhizogenes]NTI24400.1 MFS transporter [Rhizobium rhizogenes]QTG08150.1 MFS transporter [Rhizobium rhizogenes]